MQGKYENISTEQYGLQVKILLYICVAGVSNFDL